MSILCALVVSMLVDPHRQGTQTRQTFFLIIIRSPWVVSIGIIELGKRKLNFHTNYQAGNCRNAAALLEWIEKFILKIKNDWFIHNPIFCIIFLFYYYLRAVFFLLFSLWILLRISIFLPRTSLNSDHAGRKNAKLVGFSLLICWSKRGRESLKENHNGIENQNGKAEYSVGHIKSRSKQIRVHRNGHSKKSNHAHWTNCLKFPLNLNNRIGDDGGWSWLLSWEVSCSHLMDA